MKYILVDAQGGILGPFTSVEKVDNGYMCDNESYQTTVTGEVTVSEVADDYTVPQSQPEQTVVETPTEPTNEGVQQ